MGAAPVPPARRRVRLGRRRPPGHLCRAGAGRVAARAGAGAGRARAGAGGAGASRPRQQRRVVVVVLVGRGQGGGLPAQAAVRGGWRSRWRGGGGRRAGGGAGAPAAVRLRCVPAAPPRSTSFPVPCGLVRFAGITWARRAVCALALCLHRAGRCVNVDVRASIISLLLHSTARQPLLEFGLQGIKSGLGTQARALAFFWGGGTNAPHGLAQWSSH